MTASIVPARPVPPLAFVLAGGLVAGALDIGYAWLFWAVKAGLSAQRIFQSVAAGLRALIAEYREAVARFGEDTRSDTLERAAERIRQTRFKVEAYACYLAEERASLERELSDAARELRTRVEELAADREGTAAVT